MTNFSYNFAGGGALVVDSLVAEGTITARGGVTGGARLIPGTPSDTAPLTVTAGRAYAFYVDQAVKDLTSIDALVHVGTAAVAGAGGAALNWAEIAIATGELETLAAGGTTDLTIRGYASIDAEALTGGSIVYEKTISGLSIAAGTGLWVIVSSSYQTTQMGTRTWDGVDLTGRARIRAACQPSLNVGTPLAFTAHTAIFPAMHVRYPS